MKTGSLMNACEGELKISNHDNENVDYSNVRLRQRSFALNMAGIEHSCAVWVRLQP